MNNYSTSQTYQSHQTSNSVSYQSRNSLSVGSQGGGGGTQKHTQNHSNNSSITNHPKKTGIGNGGSHSILIGPVLGGSQIPPFNAKAQSVPSKKQQRHSRSRYHLLHKTQTHTPKKKTFF